MNSRKLQELNSDMRKVLRSKYSRDMVKFKNHPYELELESKSGIRRLLDQYALRHGDNYAPPDLEDVYQYLKTGNIEKRSGPFLLTSDFATLVVDSMNRQLVHSYETLRGYQSWSSFVHTYQTPDFKTIERPQIGTTGEMKKTYAGVDVSMSHNIADDSVITYDISSYASMVQMTRQAFINDDLGAFDEVLNLHTAALELESDLVIKELTLSSHFKTANSNTSTNHTTFDNAVKAIMTAMRKQTAKKAPNKPLGLELGFLLVPADLEYEALLLKEKLFGSYVSSSKPQAPFKVCVEPRLDSQTDGTKVIYGIAKQVEMMPLMDIARYDKPRLQTQPVKGDVDLLGWVLRHDVGVKMLNPLLIQKAQIVPPSDG